MAGLKITVVAVGKLKERFWKDAVAEYAKRLGGYCQLKLVEVADRDPAKCGGDAKAMEAEGADILRVHDVAEAVEAKRIYLQLKAFA